MSAAVVWESLWGKELGELDRGQGGGEGQWEAFWGRARALSARLGKGSYAPVTGGRSGCGWGPRTQGTLCHQGFGVDARNSGALLFQERWGEAILRGFKQRSDTVWAVLRSNCPVSLENDERKAEFRCHTNGSIVCTSYKVSLNPFKQSLMHLEEMK